MSHTCAVAFLSAACFLLPGCDMFQPAEPSGPVNLRPVTAAELASVVQSQRGRVVLVDFWATWCPPCRQLFPHSVALQREYGAQGLTVITVSMDDTREDPEVRNFLAQNRAETTNFIANESHAAFAKRFGYGEGIPYLLVFDRRGVQREKILGPDVARIDRAVQELLAENGT